MHMTIQDASGPHDDTENVDNEDADDMSTMGNIGEPIPSVPMQISQLAHILYQALIWFLLPRRGPERKNWHLGGLST